MMAPVAEPEPEPELEPAEGAERAAPRSAAAAAQLGTHEAAEHLFKTDIKLANGMELAIWQDPLSKFSTLLGHSLYPAACVLVQWFCDLPNGHGMFRGKHVLELGAGLGAVGMALAKQYGSRVLVTDQAGLVPLMRHNIAMNFPQAEYTASDEAALPVPVPTARSLSWGEEGTGEVEGHWDWVVGSDVAYAGKHRELTDSLLCESGRNTRITLALSDRAERVNLEEFLAAAEEFFEIRLVKRVEWKFQQQLGVHAPTIT
jgi:predicted nicotinamide N-methyase